MLTFVYLSIKNFENLFNFNRMKTLAVSLPLFRPGFCTTNIHEKIEIISSSIEKVEYVGHNLYLEKMLTISQTRKEVESTTDILIYLL